jgi:predicted metal-dependent phosphoesterase TrpH
VTEGDSMFIDTHLHEKKYSGDSFVSLEQIVGKAKSLGLNGVCITDHESNEIKEEADRLSRKLDFLIVTGAEILTYEGDMTVFGLRELPKQKLHAKELVARVKAAGGVAICAHPYRKNNRGMGDYIRELDCLWGIEAFNGSTPEQYNIQAYELARELGVPALGGSDAHHIEQVGKFATWVPNWVRDEATFIRAVQAGLAYPAVNNGSGYEIYSGTYKSYRVGNSCSVFA